MSENVFILLLLPPKWFSYVYNTRLTVIFSLNFRYILPLFSGISTHVLLGNPCLLFLLISKIFFAFGALKFHSCFLVSSFIYPTWNSYKYEDFQLWQVLNCLLEYCFSLVSLFCLPLTTIKHMLDILILVSISLNH